MELGISKLLSFEKRFVSIQALLRHSEYRKANYKKKVTLPAKKPINALCEKRLQSSMFKWTSFYNFLEFHCKILNSYAIYRSKKMVKILNCYLYAKKSYGTLSKGAIFFGQPCICFYFGLGLQGGRMLWHGRKSCFCQIAWLR